MTEIKNRIIGSGEVSLDEILFNPRNWRVHPLNQQNALKGVLEEVGWVQEVIVNQRTGHLVDGHLRCQLAAREGVKTIPVKYVDLSEEEESLVLATIDPIAAMATTDKVKLDDLFRDIQSDNEQVQELLESVGVRNGIIEPTIDYNAEWQGMPEFEQNDASGIVVTVHFVNANDKQDFFIKLGIKGTDKTRSIWYPERPENIKNQIIYEP